MDRDFRNPPAIYSEFRSNESMSIAPYIRIRTMRAYVRRCVCVYAHAQETHAFNSRKHMHTNIREHKCASNFARDRRSLAECRLFPTSQRFSRAARRQLDQNRVATTDEKSCSNLKILKWITMLASQVYHQSEKSWIFRRETVTHLGLHVTVVVAVSSANCAPTYRRFSCEST